MQTPARRLRAALFAFASVLTVTAPIAIAGAEEPIRPSVALLPTVEHLLMNLVVDEAVLDGGAGHCQYTWTQGDRSGTHRIDFQDAWDVFDLGGICVASGSDMVGLSWPAAVDVAAELVIGRMALTVQGARFDPAATGLADPPALRASLAEEGFTISVGEAAASFGTTFYQEWIVTDAAGEAWVSTYTGTPDHLPASASCAPGPQGIAECTICQATLCVNVPLDSDTARRLQTALSARLGDSDPAPSSQPTAPAETPPQQAPGGDDGCEPACHPLFEVCYQGRCVLLE